MNYLTASTELLRIPVATSGNFFLIITSGDGFVYDIFVSIFFFPLHQFSVSFSTQKQIRFCKTHIFCGIMKYTGLRDSGNNFDLYLRIDLLCNLKIQPIIMKANALNLIFPHVKFMSNTKKNCHRCMHVLWETQG